MKSRRPYLIRALYDWIVDSESTPFILVKVTSPAVMVPLDYVKDGQITLNIAPTAVRDLLIDDELMTFAGRFSGRSVDVCVPLSAIGAIYARETGDGMLFDTDNLPDISAVDDNREGGADHDLSVHDGDMEVTVLDGQSPASLAYDSVASGATEAQSADAPAGGNRRRRASHLKVVK